MQATRYISGCECGRKMYSEWVGDSKIKLWNIRERREECTFMGHTSYVASVAVSADGRFIVSWSGDTTIRLWSIEGHSEEHTSQNTQAQLHHWLLV